MEIVLQDAAYDADLAATLVAEVQQEYVARYGGPDETPVDVAEFAAPQGVFLLALAGDQAIGCAGMRRHGDGVIEIKRMFVRASHRRQGHGRRMLRALEERAGALGYRRVILETGTRQPEAIALYRSEGYQPIRSFGYYRESPSSRCFAKDL